MNKTIKIIIWVVVIVIVIGGIWYIGSKEPAKKGTIKIGAILPLTGNSVRYGEESKIGIDLAVEEINNEGGINARPIEILYEDSLDKGLGGINAYKKLNEINNVKLYLATLSNVSLAVGLLAQENQHIFFVIGSASPSIAPIGDFIFHNNIDTAIEAEKMAEFAYKNLGYKKIATLMVNSDAGQIYSVKFKEKFESLGGEVLFAELYASTATDYRTALFKIKSTSPEAIYMVGRVSEEANILKQANELGMTTPFLGTFGIESGELLEAVSKELLEGIIYTTSSYDADSSDKLIREFNEKAEERYGHKADYFSALAYDNTKILAAVMEKCGNSEDTVCIRDNMSKIDYNGVTGKTTFNDVGAAEKPIIFKTIKNGQFMPYEE